jgi:hypothetical protein
MTAIVAGAALLLLFAAGLRILLTTPAGDLARRLRLGGGAALIAVGVGLAFLRQFALAFPAVMAGYFVLRRNWGVVGGGAGAQTSNVRAAGVEVWLDHASGEMDGRVLAGRHEGAAVSSLTLSELLDVASDFAGDAESLRLLEGYLDRAHPGWRDDVKADETRRQSAAAGSGNMSTKEAYEILGLRPGASDAEVTDAHRRLMKQVHPDRGGSAALAAKINEAKALILGKHR